MDNHKTRNLRVFTLVIAGYMLLALLWWGILLSQQNRSLYETKIELIREKEKNIYSFEERDETMVKTRYERQRKMIIGESIVFVIALLIGIWFINRGYSKEIETIRQKRNFLLAITHELRSPLASIGLIFETFQKRDLEKENQLKLISHGLRETGRLAALIDNLLLSARLQKSYHPNFELLDLHPILEKVIDDVGEKFPAIKISAELSREQIIGSFDQMGLFSAFCNLIENAAKYSLPGSSVEIYTDVSGDHYMVEVRDTGPGVADSEKRKIFDQFYRSGQEETRNTPGTGIGLFIASKMIEFHHGKIEVIDNKPRGSIFRVTLPKSEI